MIIFDSSVLVANLRTGEHAERISSVRDIVRNSSVVLAELWRGAKTRSEISVIQELEENFPTLLPTQMQWSESGRVLARMAQDHGFHAAKLRDLHFDVLIALTARYSGAKLITSNRADFELIARYRPFELEIWPASSNSPSVH